MGVLQGKTAIVTGASSGIGAATAKALRREGVRVAVGARRADRLEGDLALELDVTDPASCERFVERAVAELGGLDVLVNGAGLALGRDSFDESTEEDEQVVLHTNVDGLIRMTRLCLAHMRLWGHIVNLGRPIRITTVDPGLVETDFSLVRFRGDSEKARAVYAGVEAMRPEDVAECILFALTRPPHVNVDELVVKALAQSSGGRILRTE